MNAKTRKYRKARGGKRRSVFPERLATSGNPDWSERATVRLGVGTAECLTRVAPRLVCGARLPHSLARSLTRRPSRSLSLSTSRGHASPRSHAHFVWKEEEKQQLQVPLCYSESQGVSLCVLFFLSLIETCERLDPRSQYQR